ncbi:hypothetical protein PIROE2DRAFT_1630, partial [Piromyces sp. E2]
MHQIHKLLVSCVLLVAVNAAEWGRGPWDYNACVRKVRDIYLDLSDYEKAIKRICKEDYHCGWNLQNRAHTSGDR